MTRLLFLCAALWGAALPASLPAAASDATTSSGPSLKIVRLWTQYRDAASFARRGHFRKSDDEPGDALILRSQPEQRDGFYFTIRVRTRGSKPTPVPNGTVVLHLVAPDATQTRTFTFPYSAEGQRTVQFLVGVTGADWTYGKTMPLAWKLEILDGAGATIGGQESYLWSKP